MNKRTILGKVSSATVCTAACILISGCSTPSESEQARLVLTQTRDQRELTMQQTWVGRSRNDLVKTFGNPALVMDVPGFRLPESVIFVFGVKDPSSRCIDAFVVLKDEAETIWNYFCR